MTDHPTALKPGATAPDFTLPAGPDKKISLRDFRGRTVVLAFYPADFSPVCSAPSTQPAAAISEQSTAWLACRMV